MKKLKLYENFITDIKNKLFKKELEINDLLSHLKNFIESETNKKISIYNPDDREYVFYYDREFPSARKLFYILDYSKYSGSKKIVDKNFDIFLYDRNIITPDSITMFIYDTIEKYRGKYSNNYSTIENIINDINHHNYEMYDITNKYNL